MVLEVSCASTRLRIIQDHSADEMFLGIFDSFMIVVTQEGEFWLPLLLHSHVVVVHLVYDNYSPIRIPT